MCYNAYIGSAVLRPVRSVRSGFLQKGVARPAELGRSSLSGLIVFDEK
jgi:hypothetical protein